MSATVASLSAIVALMLIALAITGASWTALALAALAWSLIGIPVLGWWRGRNIGVRP